MPSVLIFVRKESSHKWVPPYDIGQKPPTDASQTPVGFSRRPWREISSMYHSLTYANLETKSTLGYMYIMSADASVMHKLSL